MITGKINKKITAAAVSALLIPGLLSLTALASKDEISEEDYYMQLSSLSADELIEDFNRIAADADCGCELIGHAAVLSEFMISGKMTDEKIEEELADRENSPLLLLALEELLETREDALRYKTEKPYDADLDGQVTAEDARFALRLSVGLERADLYTFHTADADGDGRITPEDARIILRASVS